MSTTLSSAAHPFLTARWQHLILANYAVDPDLLTAHIPAGLALDLLDGQPHVSLVAFDFRNTRVRGIAWPGYRNFPEINLRFYVRDGDRRGVVFIREYVPKRLIASIARWLYNEPYRYADMSSQVTERDDGQLQVDHRLTIRGRASHLSVIADPFPTTPPEDSEAHFFKEHQWGYGSNRKQERVTYEVTHPPWATYQIRDLRIDWDWAGIYGPDWAHLTNQAPRSVILAHGSEIAVSPKRS